MLDKLGVILLEIYGSESGIITLKTLPRTGATKGNRSSYTEDSYV